MKAGSVWIAALAIGVALSVSARAWSPAQPPAPATPVIEGHGGPPPPGAQAPPAPAPAAPAPGQAQPRGRFPAQQRPKQDPAVVQRGRGIFVSTCGPCHGADARGGQLGGPNLLRSQLALGDKNGEAIIPVIRDGRPGTTMPPIPLADEDMKAVVAFIHDLQGQIGGQGDPPKNEDVELDILVGDAKAGEAYFAKQCATCHSVTGDLKGLATRFTEPKAIQNLWVSGGRTTGRGFAGRPASTRNVVTATVSLPSGEKVSGRLLRIDDFLVVVGLEDGTARSFRRKGAVPTVEINDPLEGHRKLLGLLSDADMHNVTAHLVTLK